jgi:hypothetical protein
MTQSYRVHVPSAPYEGETVFDLDRAWHLCLDMSEEFGYAEVRLAGVILGSYTNGRP